MFPKQIFQAGTVKSSNTKIILFWNLFYNQTDTTFGFGKSPFVKAGCKTSNCFATNDRHLFNQSDGIIIHAGNYEESDLPKHRFPHQRFIFFSQDSLSDGFQQSCFSTPHFWNWTMSHRRDSDIYLGMPFTWSLRRRNNDLSAIMNDFSQKNCLQLAKKTKLIAWFNSDCSTQSKREEYVKKLGEYIPVDIYGKCDTPVDCSSRNDPRCDERVLLEQYKFYIAAENSLCPDYITGEFYRALINNVIPIVYGGADYTQYAPSNSYINIADFKSPKDLSEYLLLLSSNEALYSKYFQWKKEYELNWKPPTAGWFDLCEKLNDPTEKKKSYENLSKWWHDDVPCFKGSSFLSLIQSE
jgi:alpha-1,3-fucosyltransferase